MTRHLQFGWLLALLAGLAVLGTAAGTRAADGAPDDKEIKAVVDKAVDFYKKRQGDDGSFSPKFGGPGITALVVASMLKQGVSIDDPVVAKALDYLEKNVQKDGGIYQKKLANYTTSVALIALTEANTKGKYDAVIKNAAKFLKTLQFDESLVEDKDVKFGGAGYDKNDRPDLSNTQYFVEALLAAGVPKNDKSIQNALKFISRCQNLPGETNDQPWAAKTTADDKGGLVYNPIASDKTTTPEGGMRSAGVMTYAGLKSFLYAGVNKDDKRVQAAVDWIRRHYSVDQNPGQGTSGLYYYYHTFGKAMSALGEDNFADDKGAKHDWRRDLF
ncbi:MAG: terpene cyclase/mutase family protein, partial [Planctomycetia bacterium]|nr:terpene cyclase/mutase family protein [Planctomycetia bacterium]